MTEEHVIAVVLVGALAFVLGWELCARKNAANAASSTPSMAFPTDANMAWFTSWGGLNR